MGIEIDRVEFDESQYERFGHRLRECLELLGDVLERPGFGQGEATIGAELELHLVDRAGRPSPTNREVQAKARDPRVALELDRFNLEINADPSPIRGFPFTALREQLDDVIGAVRRAAAEDGSRVAMIGILPTIEESDLGPHSVTDQRRYEALSRGIRRARGGAGRVKIVGDDSLDLLADDVSLEGANTSFQVHLKVPPAQFAHTYNAAQLALAPALALSTNSPLFLGRRLWEETRVALFRQSVDDRPEAEDDEWRPARVSFGHGWVRRSALELFRQAVFLHEPLLPVIDPSSESPRAPRSPALRELRLHCGTVWQWNRAIYDDADGGHLRIEIRALPAGPTTRDMVASAAFVLGLTLGLAPRMDDLASRITFGQTRRNFYEAARAGLDAQLVWPASPRTGVAPAASLVPRLVPIAREGLVHAGVAPSEADEWLGIVTRRAEKEITGARWQRASLVHSASCAEMLERYMELSAAGLPVAEWPAP